MKNLIPVIFLATAMIACDSKSGASKDDLLTEDINNSKPKTSISNESLNKIIENVPSPLEISQLIRSSGCQYDEEYLNNMDNINKYNTTYKRSLNLGVYGTDLGYITLYEKTSSSLTYLNGIKNLAEDLKIGQFFDYNTIKRMADNSENLDSLLELSTVNFDRISSFLQGHNRSEESVLMLTGGWIEALHISSQILSTTDDEQVYENLKTKIAEQKIIINDIILLLSYYKDNPRIEELLNDFNNLKSFYNKVEIQTVYKESVMEEINGMLVVTDKSESKVVMDDETLTSIIQNIQKIRNNIIS